jgi:hypothetical protein
MTEYEARFVSVGDLLVYIQPSNKWTEYCLVLRRNYPRGRNLSNAPTALIFKILVVSKSNFHVLDIPYLWLEKL